MSDGHLEFSPLRLLNTDELLNIDNNRSRMKYTLLLVAVAAARAASPPVRVSLTTSWSAPDTLVELL